MKRLLITGATGFVGRQVVEALRSQSASIVAVVRPGSEALLGELGDNIRPLSTPDLFAETEAWWEEQCRDIDTVLHLAWYVEPGKYLTDTRNLDCLTGSLRLAKGAVNAGIRRFVGVGTCFEYDITDEVLSTDTRLNPESPYAAAKAALYSNLLHWLPTQEVDFAWCRLFYLYGEGEDSRRLYPYVCEQLRKGEPVDLTSGKQIRDFLDVAVAGKQIADIALGSAAGAQNICSGIPVTVRQFVEQIAEPYGRQDLLRFGCRPDNLVDPPCVVGVPSL